MTTSQQTTGIGCDVEVVDRFNLDRSNDAAFLHRIFTSAELEYCYSFHHPAPYLVARFCTKEAVVKALSSLGEEPVDYREIEIQKNPSGVPYIALHPDGPVNPGDRYDFCLSISHSNTTAMAVILITRKKVHTDG